ncbi:LOW QUALITY PROTEIN: hypothetical protein Cgig2_003263 [Carnegiea gigantea]|uniref:Reverse transcriptase n=1 Tax=Carnegiea gigantea TaxID=171969 RepID=A0A9Q1JFS9_9CARY|nr:LOW QUALITY PROTEIN: hypothetical protein Cgig2_003263 [Carnegiea gigantea]
MDEAWCVLSDFNSILYPEDRIGGTEVQDFEIKPFANCLPICDLQEMKYHGPYYTWSNKTIYMRIDRAFTNVLWYDQFDFSQVVYQPRALSDHNPMVIDFPGCPKPPKSFPFCDMLENLISTPSYVPRCLNTGLRTLACSFKFSFVKLKQPWHNSTGINLQISGLSNFRPDKFCSNPMNIKEKEREARDRYVHIVSSDEHGHTQKRFEEVARILHTFYHKLLGPSISTRAPINHQCLSLHRLRISALFLIALPSINQQCLKATRFSPGDLPFKYLGVPISASKLSNLECRILVKKILGKIRLWSTKSISFVGRA